MWKKPLSQLPPQNSMLSGKGATGEESSLSPAILTLKVTSAWMLAEFLLSYQCICGGKSDNGHLFKFKSEQFISSLGQLFQFLTMRIKTKQRNRYLFPSIIQ